MQTLTCSLCEKCLNLSLTDCARNKEFETILLREFQDVVKAFDVEAYGEGDVRLAHGTEESAEVNAPVYSLVHHNLLKVLKVKDIRVYKPT